MLNLLWSLRAWKSFAFGFKTKLWHLHFSTGSQTAACPVWSQSKPSQKVDGVQYPAADSAMDSPPQHHVIPSFMSPVCCQGYSCHGHAAVWCNKPSQKLLWDELAWERLRGEGWPTSPSRLTFINTPWPPAELLEVGFSSACRYRQQLLYSWEQRWTWTLFYSFVSGRTLSFQTGWW